MAKKAKTPAKRRKPPACRKPCNRLKSDEVGKAVFQACAKEERRQQKQLARVLNW